MRIDLPTADSQGRRKWVYPTQAYGLWQKRRLILAILLIAWLIAAPWLRVDGKQAVFFDILHRKIHFLGLIFWVNETLVFLTFVISVFAAILLFTAVLGRVFCGWACPFTVFMEFVYRPIERLLEGQGFQQKQFHSKPLEARIKRMSLKWSLFFVVSFIVANTFIAYLFGSHRLIEMILEGPSSHMGPFIGVLVTTGLMLFQFGWFREQICLFVCPYGRLQSVLLDKNSLIVAYDKRRGEPRGKPSQTTGDCVDCKMCVKVCPTGIDIRNGLQMECIHCTQCIDACDDVMTRLKRPLGLIRYQTETEVEGLPRRILRPRLAIYSVILLIASSALFSITATRKDFSATIHRQGTREVYTKDAEGMIVNEVYVHLINRAEIPQTFHFEPLSPTGLQVISPMGAPTLNPEEKMSVLLILKLPADVFGSHAHKHEHEHEHEDEDDDGASGMKLVQIRIRDQHGTEESLQIPVLGPLH